MVKISIALCIITIFSLPVYAINWRSIGVDKSGAHMYMDLDSIEKIDKNTAIFWMRANVSKEGWKGYFHIALNKETNEYTIIKMSIYNLNGQLIGMVNYSGVNEINRGMNKNKYKASNNDRINRQIKNLIWPNY
mgnify:CR=1 FL=1